MNIKELKLKYEELGEEIKRLENKKEIWRPDYADYYYRPKIVIEAAAMPQYMQSSFKVKAKTFATFQTKEECQNFCNIIEAIAELKQWQKVYGIGDCCILSIYTREIIVFEFGKNGAEAYKQNNIGFSSKEACEEIIPQLTENCKAYLRGEYS